MSYDISFKVKVEGVDAYIDVGDCDANITWNVRKIITHSTGLEWKNEANNGLCIDIIPKIQKGFDELTTYPEKYEQYEDPNGWGTVRGTINFFNRIIVAWHDFCMFNDPELIRVTTFWVE